jgi:hypothetical protein
LERLRSPKPPDTGSSPVFPVNGEIPKFGRRGLFATQIAVNTGGSSNLSFSVIVFIISWSKNSLIRGLWVVQVHLCKLVSSLAFKVAKFLSVKLLKIGLELEYREVQIGVTSAFNRDVAGSSPVRFIIYLNL